MHLLNFVPADHKRPSNNGQKIIEGQHRWWSWRKQKRNTANPVDNSAHQTSLDNSAPQKKRKTHAEQKSKHAKRIPAHKKLKRNGSDLFDRPAGEPRNQP